MTIRQQFEARMRSGAASAGHLLRGGSTRIRLRRRLFLFSAPILLLLLAVVAKLIVMIMVGRSTVSDFEDHDIDALRTDISILSVFNVIDPGKVSFATGDLHVLEGRLTDAESDFVKTLDRTARADACPVYINIELVRETLGDLASRRNDKVDAEKRYNSALDAVAQAPDGCFRDNTDPDEQRRKIRHETEPRLRAKIESLRHPPPTSTSPNTTPPTPQSTGPQTTGPSPTSGAPRPDTPNTGSPLNPEDGSGSTPVTTAPAPNPDAQPGGNDPVFGPDSGGGQEGMNDVSPDRLPTSGAGSGTKPGHELKPTIGNPLEKLQDALENANATGDNGE